MRFIIVKGLRINIAEIENYRASDNHTFISFKSGKDIYAEISCDKLDSLIEKAVDMGRVFT